MRRLRLLAAARQLAANDEQGVARQLKEVLGA